MIYENCTELCERMPACSTCHRSKVPHGRDVAAAAHGSYCDSDCPGYRDEPTSGHLWPGELDRERQDERIRALATKETDTLIPSDERNRT